MKYLQTYTLYERVSKETKLFESSEDDIKGVIKDILLPISDMGYDVSVEDLFAALDALVIRIVTWTDEPLLITDDVKEEFITMKDYLESEGYNSIIASYWFSNSVSSSKPFDYFINNVEGSLSNLLFVAKKI